MPSDVQVNLAVSLNDSSQLVDGQEKGQSFIKDFTRSDSEKSEGNPLAVSLSHLTKDNKMLSDG